MEELQGQPVPLASEFRVPHVQHQQSNEPLWTWARGTGSAAVTAKDAGTAVGYNTSAGTRGPPAWPRSTAAETKDKKEEVQLHTALGFTSNSAPKADLLRVIGAVSY